MSQEQNNLNQNNFNTQVNNDITNNQSLNNQNFNQGINVNHQPVQSQQMQQSISQMNTQVSTPQFTNTFEDGNVNNQKLNSKLPKKNKLCLIIGVVSAVLVVVVGIVVALILNNNNGNSNNESNYVDSIKTGNIELTMTSNNPIKRYDTWNIYNENYEYFETKNADGEFIVIDSKGKQVLPIEGKKLYKEHYNYYKYLGDGYFAYNVLTDEGTYDMFSGEGDDTPPLIIVKNGKLIISLDSYSDNKTLAGDCFYKNGVLYFSGIYQRVTIAFDMKTKQELWKVDGFFLDDYVLDDDFIRLQTQNNPSGDNEGFLRDPVPNTIVDYNGKKIISGGDIKPIESFGRDKYDTQIYTSKSDAYLEIKENDYIKVYNLNNELKSTISLKETDTTEYRFDRLLYSGIFIVEETQKEPLDNKYVLYNEAGEVLATADSIDVEADGTFVSEGYILSKDYDLVSTSNYDNRDENACFLIKNGEIVQKYKSCKDLDKYSGIYGIKNNYLFVYEPDAENPLTVGGDTYKIVNVNNMKEIKAPIEYTNSTSIYDESPNGEYVILTTGNEFFVYNNELNLKYESNSLLYPVNDKYVISSNKYDTQENKEMITNLINVETGKVNKLNVKGEYYDNNAYGLVTHDGTKYYLYTFK